MIRCSRPSATATERANGIDAAEENFVFTAEFDDFFPGDGAGQAFCSDGDYVTEDFDAKAAKELLGHGSDGDAGGGFTGTGAFENVAGIGKVVFDGAREIGMAGTRAGDGLVEGGIALFDGKDFDPVLPVGVGDNHGDGGSDGTALANAGDDRHAIGLDLHAAAAAKALLPAPEFVIDRVERDGYTGRESRQGRDETLAVGLARRFKAETWP